MQRGVIGHDRTVRADLATRGWLSRECSTCPPQRGVHPLHQLFLLRLSPKADKNPLTLKITLEAEANVSTNLLEKSVLSCILLPIFSTMSSSLLHYILRIDTLHRKLLENQWEKV
jgi:hypothetical protein